MCGIWEFFNVHTPFPQSTCQKNITDTKLIENYMMCACAWCSMHLQTNGEQKHWWAPSTMKNNIKNLNGSGSTQVIKLDSASIVLWSDPNLDQLIDSGPIEDGHGCHDDAPNPLAVSLYCVYYLGLPLKWPRHDFICTLRVVKNPSVGSTFELRTVENHCPTLNSHIIKSYSNYSYAHHQYDLWKTWLKSGVRS